MNSTVYQWDGLQYSQLYQIRKLELLFTEVPFPIYVEIRIRQTKKNMLDFEDKREDSALSKKLSLWNDKGEVWLDARLFMIV